MVSNTNIICMKVTESKTIFTRMQNIRLGDLDEEGQSINNVEEALKRVDIQLRENDTTFRNMEDVLADVADKWKTFDDVTRASITQALAGTRQANMLIALLDNWSMSQGLLTEEMESSGLAAQRFGTYLNGLEASMNRFTATWEKLVADTLSSDAIKFFLDFGIVLLETVDKIGLVQTAIIGAATYFAGKFALSIPLVTAQIQRMIMSLVMTATVSVKAQAAITALSSAFGALVVGLAIAGVVALFDALNVTMNETYESFTKLKNQTDSNVNELQALANEYDTLASKQDKNAGDLSRLLDIQSIVNTKYGGLAEGVTLYSDAIDRNSLAIKENVEWLKEKADFEEEEFIRKNKRSYEDAKAFLEKSARDLVTAGGYNQVELYGTAEERLSQLGQYLETHKDVTGLIEKEYELLNGEISAAQSLIVEYEHYKNLLADISIGWQDVGTSRRNAMGADDWSDVGGNVNLPKPLTIAPQIAGGFGDLSTIITDLNTELGIYLDLLAKSQSGQELSADDIKSLAAVNADYVDFLVVEGDQLVLNEEKVREYIRAQAELVALQAQAVSDANPYNAELYINADLVGAWVNMIEKDLVPAAEEARDEIAGLFSDLSASLDTSMTDARDSYIESHNELVDKLAELRVQIMQVEAKPFSEEQRAELLKLKEEFNNTSDAVDALAAEHELATKRIIYGMMLQRVMQMDLSHLPRAQADAIRQASFDMMNDIGNAWGLIDENTLAVVQGMTEYVALAMSGAGEEAIAVLESVRAAALAASGDYYIRYHVTVDDEGVAYGSIGYDWSDSGKSTVPEKPKGGGGGGGGGGTKAEKAEPTYSGSRLYQMIIALIRQEKEAEKELIREKQENIRLEQENLKKQQEALDKQLDAYQEIIDSRKEILKTQEEELDYQEEIEGKNKSIQKLQHELAILALDDSLESKKRQLELQEELDEELQDLNETQREHAIDVAEEGLDAEYELYKEHIENQKLLLQNQMDLLDIEYDLLQDAIDAIDEFLSKSGLLGQAALERMAEMGPDLYGELIAWNEEYGSGIDEDVTRAWNEATIALEEYNNLLDVILGKSDFGSGIPYDSSDSGAEETFNKINQGINGFSAKPPSPKDGYARSATGGGIRADGGNGFSAQPPPPRDGYARSATGGGFRADFSPEPPPKDGYTRSASGGGRKATFDSEIIANEFNMDAFLRGGRLSSALDSLPKNIICESINKMGDIVIDNLINVEGNVDKNCVNDIKAVANEVMGEINNTLIRRGIIRGAQLFQT